MHCTQDPRIRGQRSFKEDERGKVMGPDGIPIEVWKYLGDIAIIWITKLFNHIFRSNWMSDEWRSTFVPIFKNKEIFKVVPTIEGLSS
jgi:hypothetical protein